MLDGMLSVVAAAEREIDLEVAEAAAKELLDLFA